jgi:hypothetical protein
MPSDAFGTASYLVEAHPDAPEPQPLWVELTECYRCGAVVHDTDAHRVWHDWLYKQLGVPRDHS